MSETHEEETWEPDPARPWMLQDGRNSTHVFISDRVRVTKLSNHDMKYLKTLNNVDPEAPEHSIDRRDEELLTFLKINQAEPTPNYACPEGVALDQLVFLGEVCSVTHFASDRSVQLGAQEPIPETLLQHRVWNEKNSYFAGAYGLVWTPSMRLKNPVDLYMQARQKKTDSDAAGIIELMHGHLVIIKERGKVDSRPYWIRNFAWRKVSGKDVHK